MELQTISQALLALSLAHLLHSFGEVRNVREKVKRLQTYINKKPYKEIPINIDTRAKGIGLGLGLVTVIFLVLWFVISLIDPSLRFALTASIVALVVTELSTTIGLDAYHAEIEKVTKPFKKK